MDLPLTTAVLAALEGSPALAVLDETVSTNDDLRAMAAGAAVAAVRAMPTDTDVAAWGPAEFTTVATASQTGGRGRLGRPWTAPPGESLALSVLVRPRDSSGVPLPTEALGWFPIIAGIAMTAAVASLLPHREVTMKWPNDVLVGARFPDSSEPPRKICGILTELVRTELVRPGESLDALVVGAGLNLAIPADRLPTATSTSLAIEGAELEGDALADAAASTFLHGFARLCSEFGLAGGDPEAGGIRHRALDVLGTVGRAVKVTLPGGRLLRGTAVDLDRAGRIVVRPWGDGPLQAVAAGDVEHLRYE
ncbi:MAG: hypothetical protein RI885_1178 [Actinomycetota bacterium]